MTAPANTAKSGVIAGPAETELSFSNRVVLGARQLLATLGYDPEHADWSERRRFQLFDKLARIAMQHAADAERLGQGASGCAVVAQCAMELVFDGRAFSPDLLAEICRDEDDEVDLLAAA